jgi:hypothetical protein
MWSLPPEMNSSGERSPSEKSKVVEASWVKFASPPWNRMRPGVGAE